MPDHPKVEPLTDASFRWIFKGLSYANRFLTDGVLPATFLAKVPDSCREELMTAGIWKLVRGKTRIHDYTEYQPTKAQVERERQSNRIRQERFRQAHVTNGVIRSNGVTNGAPARPGPTRSKTPPTPPVGGARISRRKANSKERERAMQLIRASRSRCPHQDAGESPCQTNDQCVGKLVMKWRRDEAAGMEQA